MFNTFKFEEERKKLKFTGQKNCFFYRCIDNYMGEIFIISSLIVILVWLLYANAILPIIKVFAIGVVSIALYSIPIIILFKLSNYIKCKKQKAIKERHIKTLNS